MACVETTKDETDRQRSRSPGNPPEDAAITIEKVTITTIPPREARGRSHQRQQASG